MSSRIPKEWDVLFGPAYKGIPLAAVTAMTLHKDYGVERNYTYNRKEAKDVRRCAQRIFCAIRPTG